MAKLKTVSLLCCCIELPTIPVCMCKVFSPKDRETRKARGFTFCQYRRKEDAAEAVKGMDKRVWVLFRLNYDNSVVMQTSVESCVALSSVVCMCVCFVRTKNYFLAEDFCPGGFIPVHSHRN